MSEIEDLKIAVAGTGYVGLSIATLLAQHHKVTAVDIVPEKVELINNKKSPIQDEYIEQYLAEKDLDLTAKHIQMLTSWSLLPLQTTTARRTSLTRVRWKRLSSWLWSTTLMPLWSSRARSLLVIRHWCVRSSIVITSSSVLNSCVRAGRYTRICIPAVSSWARMLKMLVS